jgi:hypothetical protein
MALPLTGVADVADRLMMLMAAADNRVTRKVRIPNNPFPVCKITIDDKANAPVVNN